MNLSRLKCISWLAVGVVFAVGCGRSSGVDRYNLRGSVSYQGKPVPYGRIVFDADANQNNRGPQGFAIIENGVYDTGVGGGKGAIGGPHIVRISGFDGKSTNDDSPYGSPLFRQYERSIDLPHENTTLDFDVTQ